MTEMVNETQSVDECSVEDRDFFQEAIDEAAAGCVPDAFLPEAPASVEEADLTYAEVEDITLKYLLSVGQRTGRQISDHIRLPFAVVKEVTHRLKESLQIGIVGAASMSDYRYELTTAGKERAEKSSGRCSYFGAAPVTLEDYFESVKRQSIQSAELRITDLCRAFEDLSLAPSVISQIGQAINAGRGLFLFGSPGNGKTSIAERVIRAVSQHIWIPRTLKFTGEIMRLYDPSNHDEDPLPEDESPLTETKYDRRWVRIRRPTIMVGGELTLDQLEVTFNPLTGIIEAPLQLKSNGGALVIDDFGRQRISSSELLNRWIVPLEKRQDFLTLPTGRQLQVPFDQLLVFATNMQPRQLVDEAFLRRIPYKIEVFDPSENEFRMLFQRLAREMAVRYNEDAVNYLIQQHFHDANRAMRYCHPRDLMLQVRCLCEFQGREFELTKKGFDVAVANYFSGM